MPFITKRDFLDPAKGPVYQALINGFDANQLTPVGYDFRAGQCINLTLGTRSRLAKGEVYPIHHGDFVIITTKETLRLGARDDIFGRVYSKVSLAMQGVSQIGTKIDPGFEGPLSLAFRNDGYNIIEITQDTSVCNVALELISATGETYSRQSFDYPILSERPRLPFPLRQNAWEDQELSRWYSREAFETYLQWSEKLSWWLEQTQNQTKESESSLSQRFVVAIEELNTSLATKSAEMESRNKEFVEQTQNHTRELESSLSQRLIEGIEGMRSSLDTKSAEMESRYNEFTRIVDKDAAKIESKYEELVKTVNEKMERADRIFIGAVVTLFVAAIAVVGVLIAAGALFINELRLQVKGGAITVPTYTLLVVVVLYAIPMIALYRLLKGGNREHKGSS